MVPGEATGQNRRMLPWGQSLGPELGPRQAERVLRKWQVGPCHYVLSHHSIVQHLLTYTTELPMLLSLPPSIV